MDNELATPPLFVVPQSKLLLLTQVGGSYDPNILMTADVACLFADPEDQQQRVPLKDDWLSQRPADIILTVIRAGRVPLMVEHVLLSSAQAAIYKDGLPKLVLPSGNPEFDIVAAALHRPHGDVVAAAGRKTAQYHELFENFVKLLETPPGEAEDLSGPGDCWTLADILARAKMQLLLYRRVKRVFFSIVCEAIPPDLQCAGAISLGSCLVYTTS